MRVLKFRAWNGKRIIDSVELGIDEIQLHPDGKGFFNSHPITPKLSQYYPHLIPMQFTGLKDKNGLDIYEGDILRENAKNEWEQSNYSCFEVFFHDGDENSDYNIGFTMARMYNHGVICGGYNPSFKPKTVSKMKIIGNIYENPELTKRP